MRMQPTSIIAYPIIVEAEESTLISSRVPVKMLKSPLPIPVMRKKKFVLTHGIMKTEAIIISPKMLYKVRKHCYLQLKNVQ